MEGRMIAAALKMIFEGVSTEIIEELTISYIGMEYREKIGGMVWGMKRNRQEILNQFKEKKVYSEAAKLLEGFEHRGDFEIQVILRNLDNVTLTAALAGASGDVVVAFLSNLSDRMLCFISEDMERWNGTEEEILAAQKKILELAGRCNEMNTLRP